MKKLLLFLAAILVMASCVKQDPIDEPDDGFLQNHNFKEMGVDNQLLAGQYIEAGVVYYQVQQDTFYLKYDCSQTDWVITETHMYVGPMGEIPQNKKDNPKIGHFPYNIEQISEDIVEYYIPIEEIIDPVEGTYSFSVAAHCIVYNTVTGAEETAWAFSPTHQAFNDKDWGWYDDVSYDDTPEDRPPIDLVYSVDFNVDTLNLYRIDLDSGKTDLLYQEVIGVDGSFDAVAYDHEEGILYFSDVTTGNLYTLTMDNSDPSAYSGTLTGEPTSGTFYDATYYYVDNDTRIIHEVTFNADGTIASDVAGAMIPYDITINDIAMSQSGTELYIIGVDTANQVVLVTYTDPVFTQQVFTEFNETVQITIVGNELYAVQENLDGSWSSYTIDPVNGTVDDGVTDNDDPDPRRSSDLSDGFQL